MRDWSSGDYLESKCLERPGNNNNNNNRNSKKKKKQKKRKQKQSSPLADGAASAAVVDISDRPLFTYYDTNTAAAASPSSSPSTRNGMGVATAHQVVISRLNLS